MRLAQFLAGSMTVAVVLGCSACGPDSNGSFQNNLVGQAGSSRPALTVMTYNIMQLQVQDWDQDKRAEALPDAIRSMPKLPDVIVFQEIFIDDAYKVIKSLKDEYPHVTPIVGLACKGAGWDSTSGNCSSKPLVLRGGVVIASKWPIAAQHQLVFKNVLTGSWDFLANKGAAYARVVKEGANYHIVGTHLQSDTTDKLSIDPRGEEMHQGRLAQLREIADWIDDFNVPAEDPVILAGDFNVPYQDDSAVADSLKASRSEMWFDHDQGFGSFSAESSNPNWMARATKHYFKSATRCEDSTLDYIVTRKDHLAPTSPAKMEILPLKAAKSWYWSYLKGTWEDCAGGKYEHDGTHRDVSDHYPVVATFTYGQ